MDEWVLGHWDWVNCIERGRKSAQHVSAPETWGIMRTYGDYMIMTGFASFWVFLRRGRIIFVLWCVQSESQKTTCRYLSTFSAHSVVQLRGLDDKRNSNY